MGKVRVQDVGNTKTITEITPPLSHSTVALQKRQAYIIPARRKPDVFVELIRHRHS